MIEIILWAILTVILIIIEAITPNLVTIWFIPGTIISLILSYFKINTSIQIIVFFTVSIIMFFIFKKYYLKFKTENNINKNELNKFVGKTALVVSDIGATKGKIIINDIYYNAMSIDENPISEDSLVKIEKVEGTTAYVSLIKKLHD